VPVPVCHHSVVAALACPEQLIQEFLLFLLEVLSHLVVNRHCRPYFVVQFVDQLLETGLLPVLSILSQVMQMDFIVPVFRRIRDFRLLTLSPLF